MTTVVVQTWAVGFSLALNEATTDDDSSSSTPPFFFCAKQGRQDVKGQECFVSVFCFRTTDSSYIVLVGLRIVV